MKKGLMIVGALVAFTFASCKKDFTCSCTDTSTNPSFSYKFMLKDSKKKAAQAVCEGKGIGSTADENGTDYPASTTTCTLD